MFTFFIPLVAPARFKSFAYLEVSYFACGIAWWGIFTASYFSDEVCFDFRKNISSKELSSLEMSANEEAIEQVTAPNLSDEEFERLWMQGLTCKDGIGRPRVWDGKDDDFPTCFFEFNNWMSWFPGEFNFLLERYLQAKRALSYADFLPCIRVMSRGIATSFKALVEGKALSIVNNAGKGEEEH